MFGQLFDLDEQARDVATACDPEVAAVIGSSIDRTQLGGRTVAQLWARDRSTLVRRMTGGGGATVARVVPNHDQQTAIDFVAERIPRAEKRGEAASLQELLAVLCQRQALLRRVRRDIQLDGWLKAWLYLHVPLTVALLGALTVHVLTTFFYW